VSTKSPAVNPYSLAARPPIGADNYRYLQDFVHRSTGIVLDDDKSYLLQSRLLPIAEAEQVPSVDDLCALLRAGAPALRRRVMEAITTHETLFFRDPPLWTALREHALPELIAGAAATRHLRILCAACSSGQEPYSLAILLHDLGVQDWNLDIVATDLSEQILERARLGHYSQLEVNRGVAPAQLQRHFEAAGNGYRLRPHIRRHVRFEAQDLRQPTHRGPFHLILCRNVLIYFDTPTKRQLLSRLASDLNRGGYLALGGTESTYGLELPLERREVGKAILYRAS